jgi:crotonobetainyl-CoA:carnitine CoA-transferase CaiB-like acyl-CoA transferase
MSSSQPLEGFTIVEIGHTVAAPYAGMVLAELGADVIKVETPASGDYTRGMPPFENGRSAVYQALNRGKRGITVDLRDKVQSGRLRRLILEKADAIIHNLKFGAMANLGFGAADLLKAKPSLVYCNVGAFGRTGPLKGHPGYDPLMQAHAGLMSIMGEDGRPPVRVGVSITDMAAGLWAVVGIQAALLERSRTGRGGVVDTSLFETALGSLTVQFASFIASGEVPKREGSGLAQMVPYQAFATSDSYVMLAAGNDNLFQKLCVALKHPDLATDPRFAMNKDRVANRAEIIGILAELFAQSSTAEWLRRLEAAQVPCSPINTIDKVVKDPQVEALGIFQNSPDGTEIVLGLPLSFDEVRPPFRRSAPKIGEHNQELLSDD